MMKRRALPLLLSLWLGAGAATGTPSPATWTRELFLGTNETSYFVLRAVREYPGSYYSYKDSVYLCRFLLASGEPAERTLVKETTYVDTTTNGDWVRTELVKNPPNVMADLVKHGVDIAFPSERFGRDRILISENGIQLLGGGRRVLLLGPKEFAQRAAGPFDRSFPFAHYYERGHLFVMVRSSVDCLDADWRQLVVRIPEPVVSAALRDLGQLDERRLAGGDRASETEPRDLALTGGVYVIKEGDSLAKIARQVYGTTELYPLILKANPGIDPRKLTVDQVLRIPPAARNTPPPPGTPSEDGARGDR